MKIAYSERGQFFTQVGFFKIWNIATGKKFPIFGLNFARTLDIPILNSHLSVPKSSIRQLMAKETEFFYHKSAYWNPRKTLFRLHFRKTFRFFNSAIPVWKPFECSRMTEVWRFISIWKWVLNGVQSDWIKNINAPWSI